MKNIIFNVLYIIFHDSERRTVIWGGNPFYSSPRITFKYHSCALDLLRNVLVIILNSLAVDDLGENNATLQHLQLSNIKDNSILWSILYSSLQWLHGVLICWCACCNFLIVVWEFKVINTLSLCSPTNSCMHPYYRLSTLKHEPFLNLKIVVALFSFIYSSW